MRILVVLLLTSLVLTACGRRGALQPPPGAAATQPQPGAAAGSDAAAAAERPDPPFVLDPLI